MLMNNKALSVSHQIDYQTSTTENFVMQLSEVAQDNAVFETANSCCEQLTERSQVTVSRVGSPLDLVGILCLAQEHVGRVDLER